MSQALADAIRATTPGRTSRRYRPERITPRGLPPDRTDRPTGSHGRQNRGNTSDIPDKYPGQTD